jgi:hypothetical protein
MTRSNTLDSAVLVFGVQAKKLIRARKMRRKKVSMTRGESARISFSLTSRLPIINLGLPPLSRVPVVHADLLAGRPPESASEMFPHVSIDGAVTLSFQAIDMLQKRRCVFWSQVA